MCLRFSSRQISSTPCVRPSSVWNGMNESGTNSVIPPVRSCSARTTRMCSASSHGSSMWPNMTVDVERRPARWVASMISTHRATGSLFGEMRSRTPSCSTSAAVPGVESRPASRSRAKTSSGGSRSCRTCARSPSASVGVQVDVGAVSFASAQPAEVVLERPSRGGCPTACRSRSRRRRPPRRTRRDELLAVVLVGVRRALALAEAAERAADDAHVRDVDVAVDDEGHGRPRRARRAGRRRPGGCPRSPPAASRRTAPSARPASSHSPSRAFATAPATRSGRSGRGGSVRPDPRRGMKLQYFVLTTSSTPCATQPGSMYRG